MKSKHCRPSGSPRPHAPTAVGGNTYSYDLNGNLTSAESRTYNYDVENRLYQVLEGGSQIRGFAYDGDGNLRTLSQGSTPKTRYVTPDYHVDIPSGEPTVYYRFGGRAIAWHNNSTIRYLLGDHLTSTQGETNETQADTAERRYFPFGGDRVVSGASDLTRDERFTGQRRVDTGNGNPRRELYHDQGKGAGISRMQR